MSIDKPRDRSGLKYLRDRYLSRAEALLRVGGKDGPVGQLRTDLTKLHEDWRNRYPAYALTTQPDPFEDFPPMGVGATAYYPQKLWQDLVTTQHDRQFVRLSETHIQIAEAGADWEEYLLDLAREYWPVEDFPNPFAWQPPWEDAHPAKTLISAVLVWGADHWIAQSRFKRLIPEFRQPFSRFGIERLQHPKLIAEREVLLGALILLLQDDPHRLEEIRARARSAANEAAIKMPPMLPYIPLIPGASAENIRRILSEALPYAEQVFGVRSVRERVVELALDKTEEEIAAQLGITPRQVSKLKAEVWPLE